MAACYSQKLQKDNNRAGKRENDKPNGDSITKE